MSSSWGEISSMEGPRGRSRGRLRRSSARQRQRGIRAQCRPRLEHRQFASTSETTRRDGRRRFAHPAVGDREARRRRSGRGRGARRLRLRRSPLGVAPGPARERRTPCGGACSRPACWRCCWRSASATAPRFSSRAASGGWRPQRSGSQQAVRRAVVDRSADELGQLARAFDRMRLRLAQLERARRDSSATRPTSCGRRSSRCAASSSC